MSENKVIKVDTKIFSEEHLKNLKQLRDYLDSLPDDYKNFHMAEYSVTYIPDDDIESQAHQLNKNKDYVYTDRHGRRFVINTLPENSCGSVCCGIGHGPAAGLKPSPGVAWTSYCIEKFGYTVSGHSYENNANEYIARFTMSYMFDSVWANFDGQNDVKSLVKRIDNVLSLGGHAALDVQNAEGLTFHQTIPEYGLYVTSGGESYTSKDGINWRPHP